MNGAAALLSTVRANGVDVCFANPGTSEMHFVAALDTVSDFRAVLCLFEGVATGAADGYARVTGRPAATLLHLGPGLGNGWANLHNARRARVPLINIVGDHALYHEEFDAPLQSDIAAVSSAVSTWHRRTLGADDLPRDAADAVAASYGPPGAIATLVLPADVSWGELTSIPTTWPVRPRVSRPRPTSDDLDAAARALARDRSALFLGGTALCTEGLALANRIATATNARVFSETFPAITDRGAGVASVERTIYLSEFAISQFSDIEHLVLFDATEPVGFFAYPDIPSRLLPETCEVLSASAVGFDALSALRSLVEHFDAPEVEIPHGAVPDAPTGALTTLSMAQAVGATLPENVIVVDESNTGGVHLYGATRFSPPHQWLTLTGGAIGFALPTALGAAIGGGGRRVLAIESDGSMMYTPQALWSMAREGLDVTVLVLSNRSYGILNLELSRVGATSTSAASRRLLDLTGPELSLCAIARAQGVPATLVTSADELVDALRRSFSTPGPTFIEAMLPAGLS
jgi:acetolactate synthase-1/2/3 large subunit